MLSACSNEQERPVKRPPANMKQALERVNKYEVKKETDEINQYVLRHNWNMKTSGTGMRYMIYQSSNGDSVRTGDWVTVNYTISLLDGTLCYSSDEDGSKEFKAEGDNVESGLHEAVLLMKVGEKGKFILPSYRAHGIRGDESRIPPMASILIDLEILKVK